MAEQSFSLLISTCGDGIFQVEDVFKNIIGLEPEIIIVHQLLNQDDISTYKEKRDALQQHYVNVKCIVDEGKGLSRSRNIALENATSKWCFISDDDNHYQKSAIINMLKKIGSDEVDVAIGRVKTDCGVDFKSYTDTNKDLNIVSAAKVSSIEICINREKVNSLGVRFNEQFGLGTSLPSCEEYIFVTDLIKLGCIVKRYPYYINTHPKESSGQNFKCEKTLTAKGAAFRHIFGFKSFAIIIAFAIKKAIQKKGSYKDTLYILKHMLSGSIIKKHVR
ncbi:glycosyltransferase [Photobacterium sp. DNB22_13_2]